MSSVNNAAKNTRRAKPPDTNAANMKRQRSAQSAASRWISLTTPNTIKDAKEESSGPPTNLAFFLYSGGSKDGTR